MESWLKARAAEAAQAAAEAAESAAKIGAEIAGQAKVGGASGSWRKEFEFQEGPFGFALEGATVATIDERGQAARLGVVPGDTLIAGISGGPFRLRIGRCNCSD